MRVTSGYRVEILKLHKPLRKTLQGVQGSLGLAVPCDEPGMGWTVPDPVGETAFQCSGETDPCDKAE